MILRLVGAAALLLIVLKAQGIQGKSWCEGGGASCRFVVCKGAGLISTQQRGSCKTLVCSLEPDSGSAGPGDGISSGGGGLNDGLSPGEGALPSSCVATGHIMCCFTGDCQLSSGCSCDHACHVRGDCCLDIDRICPGQ